MTSLFVLWQVTHETPLLWRMNAGDRWEYDVTGVQLVVRWQESQDRVVTKWLPCLPFALAPLWQDTHDFGAIPVCVKFAGVHEVVRWHESHDIAVGRWLPGLPFAPAPLWHVTHEPGAMPIWANLPGAGARGGNTGADTGVGGDKAGGVTGEVGGGATIGDGVRPGSVEPAPGCGVPLGAAPGVVATFAGVGRLPSSNDVVLWQPLQSTPA